jgi:hypothetical protein
MVHACNHSTQEAEAKESEVEDQLGTLRLYLKKENKNRHVIKVSHK